MNRVLLKIYLRQSRSHLLLTILLICGIMLGVSGVIAIDIAKTSISKSFNLSTAALASRSTHQIIGSNLKVPQSIFVQLKTDLGIKHAAPIISTHVIVKELNNKTMTFMGIDSFSEIYFRNMNGRSRIEGVDDSFPNLLIHPSGVFLSSELALQNGLKQTDEITLVLGSRQISVVIAGLLDSKDAATNMVFQGLILADISFAQETLNLEDNISLIDLILTDPQMVKCVRMMLPEGVILVKTGEQNQVIRNLSKSFENSLTAFSMLALFMGIFLIYNTVSFSVSRQRKLNGILRALGATRGDIFKTIVFEVMIYALVGSVLGVVLGILFGTAAARAVCSTVSDIYFVLTISQIDITVSTILKGLLAGVLSSFIGIVAPALIASGTAPITLMQKSFSEIKLKKYIPYLTFSGCLIIVLTMIFLTFYNTHPGYDFIGVFLILFGSSLIVPSLILGSTAVFQILSLKSFSIIFKMAIRNIVRYLSRTSIVIASLMVVMSVYIGINIMTNSLKFSIVDWIDGHVGGDIHISSSDDTRQSLDIKLMNDIKKMSEVDLVSAYNIHRIFSKTTGEIHAFSYLTDLSQKQWSWTTADEAELAGLLDKGWIFVSEIFARSNNIELGKEAKVVLQTLKGRVSFNIAGVFRDFFMGGGRIIVNRESMKKYWGHDDITAMQVFLHPGQDVASVMTQIKSFFPESFMIEVVSGLSMKKDVLKLFDRTFLITSAMQLLTIIVVITSIINSVMALVVERKKELGILRACGAEKQQIVRLLLWECGLSGFLSGILAFPFGILLSWVLINIINQRSFGWSYDMIIDPGIFIEVCAIACITAVLAGIIPAIRAGKTNIAKILHTE